MFSGTVNHQYTVLCFSVIHVILMHIIFCLSLLVLLFNGCVLNRNTSAKEYWVLRQTLAMQMETWHRSYRMVSCGASHYISSMVERVILYLARSACLPKGLYILRRVWDVSDYISVIVSQIITKKCGECVGW